MSQSTGKFKCTPPDKWVYFQIAYTITVEIEGFEEPFESSEQSISIFPNACPVALNITAVVLKADNNYTQVFVPEDLFYDEDGDPMTFEVYSGT